MVVPEAPVDKDDSVVFRKNNIGLSRKPSIMQPVAKSSGKDQLAHEELGPCVAASDVRHHNRALGRGKDVHSVTLSLHHAPATGQPLLHQGSLRLPHPFLQPGARRCRRLWIPECRC